MVDIRFRKWIYYGEGRSAKANISTRIGFNSAESFSSNATDTHFMKHFEPGHQDTLNFGSLEQSILFIESIGKEKIYEKISSLSTKAKSRFADLGLLSDSTLLRESHSSIFNLKNDEAMFQKLKSNNIICSPRGGGIRVSFHYYNSESDLDRLLEVIRK